MKYWLSVFLCVSAILFAVWLNLVYGQEERFCSRVPLSYAAGRIKAARELSGKVPSSLEEVRSILIGKVGETYMKPSLHILNETAEFRQDGFSVRLETDCRFFPVVAKDFDWKPDAFSKDVIKSVVMKIQSD